MKETDNLHKKYSLNGNWKFCLDPCEKGVKEKWYLNSDMFDKEIIVPSSIQGQDIAYGTRYDSKRTATAHESFEDIVQDYVVTRSEYRGTAWYMRDITIPEFGTDQKVWFCLDAVHPSATVWIDGIKAGEHTTGPLEPCRIDITALVSSVKTCRVTVMVTEEGRLLQGIVKWPYFSGIYKDAYLEVANKNEIKNVFVRGDIHSGFAKIAVTLSSCTENTTLSYKILNSQGKVVGVDETECSSDSLQYVTEIQIQNHQLWCPDSPYLYTCIVMLVDGEVPIDENKTRFGFRHLSRQGRQIYLNGKPIFLRGTGIAGVTSFPSPGSESNDWYRKLVARIKEYGFNYFRWHTYSMDQAVLDAADELGILIQSELFSVFYETDEERDITAEQCRLMLLRNRNHPSVACFVMGNEHDATSPIFIDFRDSLCRSSKQMSPDTLMMDSDGITPFPVKNHSFSDIACAGVNIGIGNVFDMSPAITDMVNRNDKPYMIHEYGYPESFPQTLDIPKYTGDLRPFWLEHTLESAKKRKTEDLLPTYVKNSRKLHYSVVKKAVEDARKVDELAGYGHWGFIDFVHESIGLVDLFLEDKDNGAEDFKKANGDIVLAITPTCDRFTCYQGAPYEFRLFLSNHSGNLLNDEKLEYKFIVDGKVICREECNISVKPFGTTPLGNFSITGPDTGTPYTAVIEARLKKTGVFNSWKVWFFPKIEQPSYDMPICLFKDGWQTMTRMKSFYGEFVDVTEAALWERNTEALLVTPLLTDAVADYIKRGGSVLLLPTYYVNHAPGLPMQPSSFGPMPSFAGTVGGCGTVINRHPILDCFPHEGWCDFQWYDLIGGERAPHICVPFHLTTPSVYDLDRWPIKIQPIIRSIPNWKKCNNRAYLFEVAIGKGKLLASSLHIFETMFTNPESAWLFDSVLRYATSGIFQPETSITFEQFEQVRIKTQLTSL